MKSKVIILLSSKSSGSSAVQKYLMKRYGAKVLPSVPHHENETLFWTKAASVLNLPQDRMHRSVVPYSKDQAYSLLIELVRNNGLAGRELLATEKSIFQAFKDLALLHGPVFFEKSPHHLLNYSNIELILRCRELIRDEVDIHLVGIVRNPMDTMYSAWTRWKFNCRIFEREWFQSYSNLENLKRQFPGLLLVRYEDIVENPKSLDDLCAALHLNKLKSEYEFNRRSINKWKKDLQFRHRLDLSTVELAVRFGYDRADLENTGEEFNMVWEISEALRVCLFKVKQCIRIIVGLR